MATKWYGKAASALASKKIDLLTDDIKAMLVTSTYTPNQDTNTNKADVTGESTGAGYTAGGASLSGKTFVQAAFSNTWTFDANDTTWTTATVTFRYAVLYDNTHADKPLIAYVDFGSNQTATSQDLTIKWEYTGQDPVGGGSMTMHGILALEY